MKAIVQNFPVILFIMLRKVVLTSEPMNQNSKQNHSNESYFCVVLFVRMVLTVESKTPTLINVFRKLLPALNQWCCGAMFESKNEFITVSSFTSKVSKSPLGPM